VRSRTPRSPKIAATDATHDDVVDQLFGEAENLTRIVVEGETIAEWLRLHIDPRAPQVFSWERVFR